MIIYGRYVMNTYIWINKQEKNHLKYNANFMLIDAKFT